MGKIAAKAKLRRPGAKLSNDSVIQMLRMPGQSLSSSEHKVDDFYTKIKVALAYAETKYGRSLQFQDEIVEPDSGRMVLPRKPYRRSIWAGLWS